MSENLNWIVDCSCELFTIYVLDRMRVFESKRERESVCEREKTDKEREEREREREREREKERVCVCLCVRERERVWRSFERFLRQPHLVN